jgi:hypothetical protein
MNNYLNFTNVLYVYSTIFGLLLHNILNSFGVLVLQEGVEHYREAHYSKLNCYVHTIGMPFTVLGLSIFISGIFKLTNSQAVVFRNATLLVYLSHYMQINFIIGVSTYLLFYIATIPLLYIYNEKYRFKMMLYGFIMSFVALSFQEYFGHYLGGDIPSRFESIPNAILYAMYFSVYHIFLF